MCPSAIISSAPSTTSSRLAGGSTAPVVTPVVSSPVLPVVGPAVVGSPVGSTVVSPEVGSGPPVVVVSDPSVLPAVDVPVVGVPAVVSPVVVVPGAVVVSVSASPDDPPHASGSRSAQ